MRAWLKDHPRHAVLLAATVAVPACLLIYLLVSLLSLRASYHEEVAQLEPRIARLQGLLAREAELREASSTVSAEVLDLVYPATADQAAVSATLQKQVREIFASAGLEVSNSQILPIQEDAGFDRITVQVTVEGGLAGLDVALADLDRHQPLLLVESLEVWPTRPGRQAEAGQTLTATVQVLALRLHS